MPRHSQQTVENRQLFFIEQKIHRAKKNLNFLESGVKADVLPKFTNLSSKSLNCLNLSPAEVRQKRNERLNQAIINEQERLKILFSEVTNRENYSHYNRSVHNQILNQIRISERKSDIKRNKK